MNLKYAVKLIEIITRHIKANTLFLGMFVAVLFLGSLSNFQAQNLPKQPNIIFILTDDQGLDDVGSQNRDYLKTPHLDKMKAASLVYTQWHTNPSCAPTRASLMTGKWFLKTGVFGVNKGTNHMNPEEVMIPAMLKKVGYNTCHIGKWHLGETNECMPHNKGFDEAWTQGDVYLNGIHTHFNPTYNHNGTLVKKKGWTAELNTNLAIDYIEKNKDTPFFMYLAYPEPHGPWHAPEEFVKKYTDQGLSLPFATLNGMIEHLDSNIGRLLAFLEEQKLDENTIVFFSGDNGPIDNSVIYIGNKRQRIKSYLTDEEQKLRFTSQLRGKKGQVWENGIRNNLYVKWPSVVKPGIRNNNCHPADILPTCLELSGVTLPPNEAKKIDGISLLPSILTADVVESKRPIYCLNAKTPVRIKKEGWMVRDDRSTVSVENQSCALIKGNYKCTLNKGRFSFFNLKQDPHEKQDIKKTEGLLFTEFKNDITHFYNNLSKNDRAYTFPVYKIGESNQPSVHLESCACHKYKKIDINSIVTSKWKHNSAQMIHVEVVTPGKYEVIVHAKGSKTGGELSVKIGHQTIKEKTQTAPSYKLGEIHLKNKGTSECTVALTSSLQEEVIIKSLKTIEFKRLD